MTAARWELTQDKAEVYVIEVEPVVESGVAFFGREMRPYGFCAKPHFSDQSPVGTALDRKQTTTI